MSLLKLFIVSQLLVITGLLHIEVCVYLFAFDHIFDALVILLDRLLLVYLYVIDGTSRDRIKLQVQVLLAVEVDKELLVLFLLLLYEFIAC
ncbi:MAG: hypothetical protein ACMG6E_03670 [Candidatus Roizmanbacteria bacterium]